MPYASHPPMVIYYVTDDLHNARDHDEIRLLQQVGRVVIVTQPGAGRHPLGLRQVALREPCGWQTGWLQSWARASFLLCRVGQGEIDKRFPERNLFTGGPVFRRMVNFFWSIKTWPLVSGLLPTYSGLYFAPLRLAQLWRSAATPARRYQRIIVFDSVLNRVARFAPFIEHQRQRGAVLVANVKSWDNAFYTRIATEADGFLVWSPAIWHDLQSTHELRSPQHLAWGARPFFDFDAQRRAAPPRPAPRQEVLTLGYAAAYAHPHMGRSEAMVIATLARHLQREMPGLRLLFRPYPTHASDVYAVLQDLPGVEVQPIASPPRDRFGDGRECIRFGHAQERLDFLNQCDAYLSLATSFTLEACVAGLPILQLALSPDQRHSPAEQALFHWMDISDHLQRYFLQELPTARSHEEVALQLAQLPELRARSLAASQRLMSLLRLPGAPQPDTPELVRQLRQFMRQLTINGQAAPAARHRTHP